MTDRITFNEQKPGSPVGAGDDEERKDRNLPCSHSRPPTGGEESLASFVENMAEILRRHAVSSG